MSTSPTSISNAEHYRWGTACDGWHLLNHPDLSVSQERVPPGQSEIRHYHTNARQFFFVLGGRATLEFDDGAVSFGAGEGIHVPAGVPHRFVNAGTEVVDFLVISAPTTRGDRTDI